MSDLIDRQAAIEAICEHGTELERRGITVLAVANHKQATVDLLESLPSAQSEIIRCKDCYLRYTSCPMVVRIGNILEFFTQDYDFCSRAQREGEENHGQL